MYGIVWRIHRTLCCPQGSWLPVCCAGAATKTTPLLCCVRWVATWAWCCGTPICLCNLLPENHGTAWLVPTAHFNGFRAFPGACDTTVHALHVPAPRVCVPVAWPRPGACVRWAQRHAGGGGCAGLSLQLALPVRPRARARCDPLRTSRAHAASAQRVAPLPAAPRDAAEHSEARVSFRSAP